MLGGSMRLFPAAIACALVPAIAEANGPVDPPTAVIGGANAAPGAWPDAAAVLFPVNQTDVPACSGTLIAPTVVLTAGHCDDPAEPPLPDHVLIGTSSLARPGDGETLAIARGIPFPDAAQTEDVALLILAQPSSRPPRKIATGWARADLVDGAAIALVGFGAINKDGDQFVDALQEARTTITDADCSTSIGCNPGAQPAGELGAGGMGIDTCPGDSGGPLYLTTAYGTFLAGVTSRAYGNAQFECSEGGIYERPDKIVDWIEAAAGVAVARGPEPSADPITAIHGDGGETAIDANDPAAARHTFAVTTPPTHGAAEVRSDGVVRVCTDAAAAPGDDQLTVTITDASHPARAVVLTIPIHIEDGAPAQTCNPGAFDTAELDASGGGCCDAGRAPGGALPLAIGVLALITRRRR
jgi:endonuclease G